MFVLLISFVFSSMLGECEIVQSNHTLLKHQLQKSLTHVNAMLADIEHKIESERKMLSQIDYDINYKHQPGFLDYAITDIWWQTTIPTPTQQSTATPLLPPTTVKTLEGAIASRSAFKEISSIISYNQQITQTVKNKNNTLLRVNMVTPDISEIVSDWVLNKDNINTGGNLTKPPHIVRPTIRTTTKDTDTTLTEVTTASPVVIALTTRNPNYPPGVPPGWPNVEPTGEVTTHSPVITELYNTMILDKVGHFSAFATKFLELLSTKETENVTPILDAFVTSFSRMVDEQKLDSMGQTLQENVLFLLNMMNSFSPSSLQQQAGVGHYVMKNKKLFASNDVNACVDLYDTLFSKDEGHALFASLEEMTKYPDGGKSANEVSQVILEALVAPFIRLEGTRNQKKLINSVNQAIQAKYKDWRAKEDPITENATVDKSSNFSTDKDPLSIQPSRRRMGPGFKKIIRHFLIKHPKLFKSFSKHLTREKKSKHHHGHRKKHHHVPQKAHRKHGHGHEKLMKKKDYIKRSHKTIDTSASEAYYREPTWQTKRIQQNKIMERPSTKPIRKVPNLLNKNIFLHLKKQFGAAKAKNFRRYNIESSDKDIDNYKSLQSSVDKNILHKIREASSYSDEEDYIKANLYDALRHGNRTYVQFRGTDFNNQTLRDLSSAADDEWIIKNNIYKVFQYS